MQEGQKISLRDYVLPPIHPEGVGFLLIFIFITFVLWIIWAPLGLLGLVLLVWCFYFFRDPEKEPIKRLKSSQNVRIASLA